MKRTLSLVLCAAALLASAGPVRADLYARLQGIYALPTGTSYSGSVGFGIAAGWELDPRFSLELGLRNWSLKSAGSVDGLSLGKLNVLPVEVALKARFPLGEKLTAFGEAAAGYAIHSFKLDEDLVDDYDSVGFEIDETCNGGLAVRLGAGIELVLSPKMSLDFTAGYTLLKGSGEWSITDVHSGETASGMLTGLSFDTLTLSLGLKIALSGPGKNQ
ncbi:MAG: outer membrane beta-barrel protein [Candidatus Aminicenantes bacterium]|nr:outer membrane beta-barrel protein [Candidatus Aminicenantes bacterium]